MLWIVSTQYYVGPMNLTVDFKGAAIRNPFDRNVLLATYN